ncbi:hypothetical protein AMTRI_Chr11g100510 [Amborella trichopoda]
MAIRKPVLCVLFLLSLLLVSSEMGRVVEGRICESPSIEFQGPCIIRSNCANVCKTEGFEDGHCEGIWLICMCTEQC